MSNGKGTIAKLADGTIVSYRKVSSSDGTPAVDINIKKSKETGGVKQQKMYFVKEKMTKIQDYRFLNCKVDTCEK